VSHWGFIIGAYALTAAGTIVLVWTSWAGMRRAERDVEALRSDR